MESFGAVQALAEPYPPWPIAQAAEETHPTDKPKPAASPRWSLVVPRAPRQALLLHCEASYPLVSMHRPTPQRDGSHSWRSRRYETASVQSAEPESSFAPLRLPFSRSVLERSCILILGGNEAAAEEISVLYRLRVPSAPLVPRRARQWPWCSTN